jgi:hypothetical protein
MTTRQKEIALTVYFRNHRRKMKLTETPVDQEKKFDFSIWDEISERTLVEYVVKGQI